MKVDGLVEKLSTYEQQKIEKAGDKERQARESSRGDSDSVTLSSRAKTLKELQAAVKDSPDVRSEKVAELRERVESGQYEPDAHTIAQKLLEEERDLWS